MMARVQQPCSIPRKQVPTSTTTEVTENWSLQVFSSDCNASEAPSHGRGRWFEPSIAHFGKAPFAGKTTDKKQTLCSPASLTEVQIAAGLDRPCVLWLNAFTM
jgi:hypothetical protein